LIIKVYQNPIYSSYLSGECLLNTQQIVHLTPPSLSEKHIKEKIICIRAHRERIFQVSTQILDNKLIFHNYGQGGAGWTFLFGCVNESIRQFEQQLMQNPSLKDKSIAVIGAGCYGLLTAIILARKGHSVHIIAKDTENIPSFKAAGFFFPRARKCSTLQERALFELRGMESYRIYQQIMNGTHPFITKGATLLPAYFGLDINPGFAPYITHGLIDSPEKITIDFGNGKKYDVNEYKILYINSAVIMQELHRTAAELGIITTHAEIATFSDVTESIIFNCTGLGAKQLTGDKRIIPVQGHLITLKNQLDMQQLQYLINVKVIQYNEHGRPRDELIYYAPKESGILGITFLRGQDSHTTNHHEFERLLQRSKDFFGT
jgi:hypothetical protein